ncbi:class F sortase [Nocardioides nanhaiensis]|uniref:Class F sortase n=1 Tax=Nocardioides nanhaiensis TaxID=1476871 RepID=A0ABP8WMQ5_9ACTN
MRARALVVAALLSAATAGCGAPATTPDARSGTATSPGPSGRTPDTAPDGAGPTPAPAREGRTAASQRVTFAPQAVVLPDGARAPVRPATTRAGELVVPEDVRHVGWWDGSAAAGDPFGSTVVAGHVDSATAGLGYFARLLDVRPGEQVTLRAGARRAVYRVTSVRTLDKQSLATTAGVLDQTGPHRLVLITCSGSFTPGEGYDSNLVVVAEPVGPAR